MTPACSAVGRDDCIDFGTRIILRAVELRVDDIHVAALNDLSTDVTGGSPAGAGNVHHHPRFIEKLSRRAGIYQLRIDVSERVSML